jgi:hypothetical protein
VSPKINVDENVVENEDQSVYENREESTLKKEEEEELQATLDPFIFSTSSAYQGHLQR